MTNRKIVWETNGSVHTTDPWGKNGFSFVITEGSEFHSAFAYCKPDSDPIFYQRYDTVEEAKEMFPHHLHAWMTRKLNDLYWMLQGVGTPT